MFFALFALSVLLNLGLLATAFFGVPGQRKATCQLLNLGPTYLQLPDPARRLRSIHAVSECAEGRPDRSPPLP